MKTLRYFFVAALAMVGMNAMADDVVFDFTDATKIASYGLNAPTENGTFEAFSTLTAQGYTISATDGKTPTRIYKSSPTSGGEGVITLRVYADATLTIKAAAGSFKSITFETNANDGLSTTNGTYADGVWAGEATEVTFNVSKTVQIKTITIGQEAGVVPTPVAAEEITIAKALEIAGGLADKASTDEEYIVKGFIASDIEWVPYYKVKGDTNSEILNYNIEFILGETADAATGLTIYQPWSTNNERFAQPESAIVKGNQVILQGKIAKYGEKLELTKCHFLTYDATGIAAVKNVKAQNGVMYNLAGQVVNKGYKGLVIMNGRKFMNK